MKGTTCEKLAYVTASQEGFPTSAWETLLNRELGRCKVSKPFRFQWACHTTARKDTLSRVSEKKCNINVWDLAVGKVLVQPSKTCEGTRQALSQQGKGIAVENCLVHPCVLGRRLHTLTAFPMPLAFLEVPMIAAQVFHRDLWS
jgi:hypothetical protein